MLTRERRQRAVGATTLLYPSRIYPVLQSPSPRSDPARETPAQTESARADSRPLRSLPELAVLLDASLARQCPPRHACPSECGHGSRPKVMRRVEIHASESRLPHSSRLRRYAGRSVGG